MVTRHYVATQRHTNEPLGRVALASDKLNVFRRRLFPVPENFSNGASERAQLKFHTYICIRIPVRFRPLNTVKVNYLNRTTLDSWLCTSHTSCAPSSSLSDSGTVPLPLYLLVLAHWCWCRPPRLKFTKAQCAL